MTLQLFALLHGNLKDCAGFSCLLPTVCQLRWENKVHSWHISIPPWTLHTWEDTSGFPSGVSRRGDGLVMDGPPDHPSHRCAPPHSEAWGGSCISLCRYVDAWETAATGWGDKTAHFILWTSDSAASSTQSGSTGPDWNWITRQQEGVGTRLSEQSQETTGSGLRYEADGGSVEFVCVYTQRPWVQSVYSCVG